MLASIRDRYERAKAGIKAAVRRAGRFLIDTFYQKVADAHTVYVMGRGESQLRWLRKGDSIRTRRDGRYEANRVDRIERRRVDGRWVVINGHWKLYGEQSVVTQRGVIHARMLRKGDVLTGRDGMAIGVVSLKKFLGTGYYYRLTIGGDHTYYQDGLLIHNASRYFNKQNASANLNVTGPTNWGSASNTADGASVPGSTDDVFFDGVGGGANDAVLNANMTWNSYDFTGYANQLTHNSGVTLTCGGTTVTCKFVAGMTYTLGSATTSALAFTGTSGTVSFTTGGKTFGNIAKSGVGGTLQLQDDCLSTGTVTLTSGGMDANNKNVTCIAFSSNNSNTRVLTMGSGTWEMTGSGAVWDTSFSTGMTFSGASATLKFSYSGATSRTFTASNSSTIFGNVLITAGTGTFTAGQANTSNTFQDYDLTGFSGAWNWNASASTVKIAGSLTLPNTLTGVTMPTALQFTATSTGKTITTGGNALAVNTTFNGAGGGWTFQDDCSFTGKDVTHSNGTLDLNGKTITCATFTSTTGTRTLTLTNSTLVCTGSGTAFTANGSGMTFTGTGSLIKLTDSSASARTFDGGSRTYNDLQVTAGTGTTTISGNNTFAGNVDLTGFSGTLATGSATSNFQGNLDLGSTASVTGTGAWTFGATATGKTIRTNAKALGARAISFNGVGGGWTLQDSFTTTSTITISNGNLNTGGFAVFCTTFSSSGTATRTLTIDNSTVTATSTGTVWGFGTTTGLTFSATGSTIKITDTSATAKTFAGGGLTYGTLEFAKGAGTSTDDITGNNTFAVLKNSGTAAFTVRFPNGGTTTLSSAAGWQLNGTAGAVLSFTSTTGGTATNLSCASGAVLAYYVSIKDNHAAGGATFTADTNSTNVSGNTGWKFTTTPAAKTKSLQYAVRTTPAASTKSLQYTLKTSASKTPALQYMVKTTHAATKGLTYDIVGPLAVTKQLRYAVLTSPALTPALRYAIITTPAAKTESLRYAVAVPTGIALGLTYDIVGPVAVTKSLQYAIVTTPAAAEAALRYAVLTSPAIGLGLTYRVIQQGAPVSKSLQYAILTTDARTADLEYRVNVPASRTLGLQYEVLTTGDAIGKSLQYVVVHRHVASLGLQYAVRIYPYTKKKSPYVPL